MSKKLLVFIAITFLALSIGSLLVNMPEKKNIHIYNELKKYFPYKLKKELSGVDIVDSRTGKDLDIDNAKVFLVYDDLLKKWGKEHIKLKGDILILYDNDRILQKIKLTKEELGWVENFFNLKKSENL